MHRGISLYIYFHETYAFTLKRLMLFFKLGIRDEDGQFSQIPNKRIMDYHKKMVAAPPQKCKHEDDDDDVEALRFAALQSLRTAAKDPSQNRRPLPHQGRSQSYQGSQSSRPYYNKSRGDHFSHRQQRQNGTRNNYAQKNYRNPNLIEIVPVVEVPATSASKENIDTQKSQSSSDGSKFQRYDDNASGSEDEDVKDTEVKDIDAKVEIKTEEKESTENEEVLTDKENESGVEESPKERTAEEEEEDRLLNDDDDDVLLMADLEEEVSLDRLMDEMEREIKDDKIGVSEKKSTKKEKSELKKVREQKKSKPEVKPKEEPTVKGKSDVPIASKPPPTAVKPEPRPVSPRPTFRRRSMSPKPRPWRKASPRRSPRRSPMRILKKLRYRSPPPRYSPRSPRLSPRPRSPRMSPRRSPNRSPMRRSPLTLRNLSPRGRSPRLSPRPRSPRIRSRSPRSRSRSPRRSPRRLRSRSPRYSPHRYSPRMRSRSPRSRSPRSPRRRLSRSRSPRSPRRGSPRLRSPRMSPRRLSPRYRSPRGSPRRSPWSSPRRSPRMSPKRAWSPRWSPKDSLRKPRPKSITPEKRSNSPQKKEFPLAKSKSPDTAKLKPRRDIVNEKSQVEPPKEPEPNPDPILEARRRKFESQTPIDPINANKKIKLSNKKEEPKKLEIKKPDVKKVEVKKPEPVEETEEPENKGRKVTSATAEYSEQEDDLCLDTTYEFEELEEEVEEEEQEVEVNSTEVSLEVEPVSHEKKRKKKKDKEIYQVGKLKGDVPLAERVLKEKKFKKRKVETMVEGSSEVETVFEDASAADEEGDLRAELSRRRAERLNRTVPMQSARLLQSAFKGVVNEVAKNNAKVNQRIVIKGDEKPAQKEVRRVTVLHRTLTDFHDSEEETALETKVPVRLRLGLNKAIQETRETKVSRKSSKRQGRKTIAALLGERSLLKEELKSLDDELKDQKSYEIKENQETIEDKNNNVLIIEDRKPLEDSVLKVKKMKKKETKENIKSIRTKYIKNYNVPCVPHRNKKHYGNDDDYYKQFYCNSKYFVVNKF